MLRKTACAVGGVAVACAAAYSLASAAQSSGPPKLDLNWLYASSAKADRLPVVTPMSAGAADIVSFDLPAQGITIVARGPVREHEESALRAPRNTVRTIPVHPVREVPNEEPKKEKLPEGCEPAFSPVTMPAFAHISVRCDS
jgi:hypothetical protein